MLEDYNWCHKYDLHKLVAQHPKHKAPGTYMPGAFLFTNYGDLGIDCFRYSDAS